MDSAGNQGTDRQLPRGLPRWSYPGIEDLPRHGIWSCGLPTMARPQICLPRAADPTLAHGTYPVMKTTRPAAEDVDMGGVKPRGFPLLSPACSKINRWEISPGGPGSGYPGNGKQRKNLLESVINRFSFKYLRQRQGLKETINSKSF